MSEPYVTVNPADPNNVAAIWIADGLAGNVVGTSLDGGQTWQNVALPGLTVDTGGTSGAAGNPWISFAPNGDLYASSLTFANKNGEVSVNKFPAGGPTWSNPIVLRGQANRAVDKPSITADPTDSTFVYATWADIAKTGSINGNNASTMFARSTDGGQTWQPAQSIHDAQGTDFNWGQQIVVLPDGTLIDAFTEGTYNGNHQAALTLLRSTDHGQTWSAPIQAVVQEPLVARNINPPNATVTDPDTGQEVEAHPMFPSVAVDRNNGNLYAVWIDARFSNFQYNSIVLSMSSDGGFTWSAPVQVNKTPNTVPPIDRQAWNPTVAVAADGTVAVSYYDFRNNTPAPGALTDYWLAYCHPSPTAPATDAANWSEVRLTDASFDLEQAPTRFFGAFWLGDGEGLAAAGNDFVAVWAMPDGTSTGKSSIFFRRVMSTGTGGSQSFLVSPAAPTGGLPPVFEQASKGQAALPAPGTGGSQSFLVSPAGQTDSQRLDASWLGALLRPSGDGPVFTPGTIGQVPRGEAARQPEVAPAVVPAEAHPAGRRAKVPAKLIESVVAVPVRDEGIADSPGTDQPLT
jgi:hypothetical protein